MSYQVLIVPAAQRQLKKLPVTVQQNVVDQIERLADNPRPANCKKLKGRDNQYRVRLGNYRIIYTVEDDVLTIRVIKVGHRRDVYEG
ncbi:MAG: type II toxin-antitoxin system RelE/ParE family toxin [Elainellaceae cyanobacterium]